MTQLNRHLPHPLSPKKGCLISSMRPFQEFKSLQFIKLSPLDKFGKWHRWRQAMIRKRGEGFDHYRLVMFIMEK